MFILGVNAIQPLCFSCYFALFSYNALAKNRLALKNVSHLERLLTYLHLIHWS